MGKHSVQIDDSILYNKIVEYCKFNGLKIGAFITEMIRKQFMIEQYGDIPFGNINEVKPILSSEYEKPEPIKPTLPIDYETPEPVETVLDISKKEVPNKFYGTIQYDESWEENLEKNIENGSVIMLPYTVETNGPMIVVNHSKEEETSAQADKVKKEEKQKKPKKRRL
jgi:hypothetical protein